MDSLRENRFRAALLAGLAAACSACATAPVSVADRQAASDAEVDLAVCVTENEKGNIFFNPLPKMLADQVESRFRPPRKPSFRRLTRLPFGGDADACEVLITMRADGQAIWNLRHAVVTDASTKEELLHTSSQQACGPCFAGMMDGLIIPVIKALDSKGPLHAKVMGGRGKGAPSIAAAAPAAPAVLEYVEPPPAGAPAPSAPPEPAPKPVPRKVRSLADFSSAEMSEMDAQIFP